MPLPKVTGPDSTLFTELPIRLAQLTVFFRIRFIPGPTLDAIHDQARTVNHQRLLDARAAEVAKMIAGGASAEEADSAVPGIESVPVLVDDVGPHLIAAGVDGVRSATADDEKVAGAGDDDEPVWEDFTVSDAFELWCGTVEQQHLDAWPGWARLELYNAVRNFSTRGSLNPLAK